MQRLLILCGLLAALPLAAQPQRFVEGQRALGPVIVREISIRDGVLVARVESGGCTDASSFKVDVVKEEGFLSKVPHYRLTIRRIRADDCKALLVDGVLIELDLARDVGLTGRYTVSVENPVLHPAGGAS